MATNQHTLPALQKPQSYLANRQNYEHCHFWFQNLLHFPFFHCGTSLRYLSTNVLYFALNGRTTYCAFSTVPNSPLNCVCCTFLAKSLVLRHHGPSILHSLFWKNYCASFAILLFLSSWVSSSIFSPSNSIDTSLSIKILYSTIIILLLSQRASKKAIGLLKTFFPQNPGLPQILTLSLARPDKTSPLIIILL